MEEPSDLSVLGCLTIREAAALYGCTPSNMSYLVHTRRIPAMRLGRFWVMSRVDVEALKLSRNTREHTNAFIQAIEVEDPDD